MSEWMKRQERIKMVLALGSLCSKFIFVNKMKILEICHVAYEKIVSSFFFNSSDTYKSNDLDIATVFVEVLHVLPRVIHFEVGRRKT